MSYPGIVFSFFLRGPCFTPHAACCLCMTSCVAGACVVFALLCCFLEGWVWILWPPEMWLFLFSFCTQSCQSTSSVCLPEVPQINAPMTHTSILVSGGWRSRAVILQSLSDHTVLVCSVCAHLMLLTSGKTVSTSSPSHLLLLYLFLLSVSSLPPPNRLAGSSGDWRKRPGVSTLSLWFGPTGRDSRYLPAPRRSHQQVCHLLDTPDFPHPPQGSSLSLSRRCPRDTSCIL